jgi:hypothetical protein
MKKTRRKLAFVKIPLNVKTRKLKTMWVVNEQQDRDFFRLTECVVPIKTYWEDVPGDTETGKAETR